MLNEKISKEMSIRKVNRVKVILLLTLFLLTCNLFSCNSSESEYPDIEGTWYFTITMGNTEESGTFTLFDQQNKEFSGSGVIGSAPPLIGFNITGEITKFNRLGMFWDKIDYRIYDCILTNGKLEGKCKSLVWEDATFYAHR